MLMGLPELKNKIHLQIENADERVLRIISSVFDNYYDDGIISDSPLSTAEKKAIDEALVQVANGQTISHDIVMEETKKRYPKFFKNGN
jgi:hypothetical protein